MFEIFSKRQNEIYILYILVSFINTYKKLSMIKIFTVCFRHNLDDKVPEPCYEPKPNGCGGYGGSW